MKRNKKLFQKAKLIFLPSDDSSIPVNNDNLDIDDVAKPNYNCDNIPAVTPTQINNIEILKSIITPMQHNRDSQHIIQSYLRRNKRLKILKLEVNNHNN